MLPLKTALREGIIYLRGAKGVVPLTLTNSQVGQYHRLVYGHTIIVPKKLRKPFELDAIEIVYNFVL